MTASTTATSPVSLIIRDFGLSQWQDAVDRTIIRMGQEATDKYLTENPNAQEEFLSRCGEFLQSLADALECRDIPTITDKLHNGTFHIDNMYSRRVFEAVTGRKLPATVRDTRAVVLSVFPEILTYEAEQERVREQERLRAESAEAERVAEQVSNTRTSLMAGEIVEASDLEPLFRLHGVAIRPNTLGAMRKRLERVQLLPDGRMAFWGSSVPQGAKDAVFNLVRTLRD